MGSRLEIHTDKWMLSEEPWLEIRLRPVPSVAVLMITNLAGRFTPAKGSTECVNNSWESLTNGVSSNVDSTMSVGISRLR